MPTSVIDQGGLPRPDVSPDEAALLAQSLHGIDVASVRELGSQQDRNFLLSDSTQRWLFKVSNPAFTRDEVAAQNAAMETLAAAGLNGPVPVTSPAGLAINTTSIQGKDHCVRLLTFVDGTPLIDRRHLSPTVLRDMGRTIAGASAALATFRHPGLERNLQWDLRAGEAVVAELLDFVKDARKRDLLSQALSRLTSRLQPLKDHLPVQAVHGDITDDNLVFALDDHGGIRITGIIDFSDTMYSWRIAELAAACASIFHHSPQEPLAILPLITSFNEVVPMVEAEIEALWPLIVLRGAVLAVSGEQQTAIDPGNDYASSAMDREWEAFDVPAGFDWDVAEAAIRAALGQTPGGSGTVTHPGHLLLSAGTQTLNLGWDSESYSEGSWLAGPAEERKVIERHLLDADVVLTRFGEPRLTRARPNSAFEPANVALAVEIHVKDRQTLHAPFPGAVTFDHETGALTLTGVHGTVILQGLLATTDPTERPEVSTGEPLGLVGPDGVAVWHARQATDTSRVLPPRFVRASEFPAYASLYRDPSALLTEASEPAGRGDFGGNFAGYFGADAGSVVERRRGAYNSLQIHYYGEPPRIERGWKEHLIDTSGRNYLDMVNNVTVLGHGHPAVAATAHRQWSMLNTNSRFNYDAVVEFSERLLSRVPSSLDTVFLVNSGTEAVDLALRLSKAFTQRDHVLCCEESYHGWSLASDAVSTSTSDNPQAATTRPPWVHVAAAPNDYRGNHRGDGAGLRYAEDAARQLEHLSQAGTPVGTFIAEPRNGNAGAIATPPGYLKAMYANVRSSGGVCISDEVQVGYGRLGKHFWGFEEHDAVPDIITIAKAMGNGHPLGAVITRCEIADALAAQGAFFSSAGGSTLSSRIGLTVLDVIESENLQANAALVGQVLTDGFAELMDKHSIIGAIHGMGLYQGLEFVRDRDTLEPAAAETRAICDRMLHLGVVVLPTGDRQNILKIKPPLCIAEDSARFFLRMLDQVLTEGW
ncbi:aminotransferase [Paenarthrobacter ilicis]|uniref:aminotransferase n=1 Tax=Paenarthrobacter ilicis TaxID=43665 RepID=UPI00386B11B4